MNLRELPKPIKIRRCEAYSIPIFHRLISVEILHVMLPMGTSIRLAPTIFYNDSHNT